MKTTIYINKVRVGLLLLAACLIAVGCSKDSGEEPDRVTPPGQDLPGGNGQDTDDPEGGDSDDLHLVTYMPSYVELTRGVPTGYSTFTPGGPTSIGIFMTPENTTSLGYFTYNGAKWSTTISVKMVDYHLYGFMPGNAAASSTISMLDGQTGFAPGAVLTLTGLSPVSGEGLSVITGVQGVQSSTAPQDIQLGRFAYTGQEKGKNYVYLLMDYLYSCVQFRIKVDATYNTLRTIKLKRMELTSDNVSSVNAVVTLTANSEGEKPITSVAWTPTTGSGATAVLFESADGEPLSTAAKNINAHQMPAISGHLAIKTVYDVYDKHDNLIRKDCAATNKLPDALGIGTMQAGELLPVNLTINPTYIYVLSDPDLDNPTVTVE